MLNSPALAADRTPECEAFLADVGQLVGRAPADVSGLGTLDKHCRSIRLDTDLVNAWSLKPAEIIQDASAHPGWRLEDGALILLGEESSEIVFRTVRDSRITWLSFDDAGQPWWLVDEPNGGYSYRTVIWRQVQGRAARFAAVEYGADQLIFDSTGVWAVNLQTHYLDMVWSPFTLSSARRFDFKGRLQAVLESAPYTKPAQPELEDGVPVSYLQDLAAGALSELGYQPAFAERQPAYQFLFLTTDGRPIPIPEDLGWLHDRQRQRGWLIKPDQQQVEAAEKSQSDMPPWAQKGPLYLLTPEGRLKAFPQLGEVSLLRLDEAGRPWLRQGQGKKARGLVLEPDRQGNFVVRSTRLPMMTGKEKIGARVFDPASGYELERLPRPEPMSPGIQVEIGERNLGRVNDEPFSRIELRLRPSQHLLTETFQTLSSDWHEITLDLWLRPELNLMIEYGSDTYTHPYSPGVSEWLYVKRPDHPDWLKSPNVGIYRILNP